MEKEAKIYIAGHSGLLGSAVYRKLEALGHKNLLCRSSTDLNLLNQHITMQFLQEEKPDYVFLCAAKVGGIKANMDGLGEFLYKNLQIQNNIIEGARLAGVKKLLFVASTCVYPKEAKNPINEDQILTGPLEPTNEGYAIAKLAGVKMCEFYRKQYGVNFVSAIPCNLFGPNDHYDPNNSHVLQSLIRKIHLAKVNKQNEIELWGSGNPRREFMLSDDCADALVFLMNKYEGAKPVNVGIGSDASIVELAKLVSEALDHPVSFKFDATKPDGMFRKLADSSFLKSLGWSSLTPLRDGIRLAYQDFLRQER